MKKIISLVLVIFISGKIFSQDTLPKFTLANRGEKVTISWINPFHNLSQLNIQRSYDSLKNFATVYSATSPQLPQNGFTDTKPAYNKVFYRIFFALEGGTYFFSKSKRAEGTGLTIDFSAGQKDAPNTRDLTNNVFSNIVSTNRKLITIKMKDVVYQQLSVKAFLNFKDSILRQTKDTLYAINDSLVGLNPYIVREVFKTSSFVFINKDGFINVSLPIGNERKYTVRFFEEDGTSLFEIRNAKESPLLLDKSNFVHAGWFLFELYEDNKLKEKNKLFVPKDF